MALEAIIAVNKKGFIGKDDVMLWRDAEDFRRFKELTMGRVCIVGRKTAKKLPKLPGRKVVVVSHGAPDFGEHDEWIGGKDALAQAIEKYPDAMIIGGAQIYKASIPYVKRWIITLIDDDQVGDTKADFIKDIFPWNINT